MYLWMIYLWLYIIDDVFWRILVGWSVLDDTFWIGGHFLNDMSLIMYLNNICSLSIFRSTFCLIVFDIKYVRTYETFINCKNIFEWYILYLHIFRSTCPRPTSCPLSGVRCIGEHHFMTIYEPFMTISWPFMTIPWLFMNHSWPFHDYSWTIHDHVMTIHVH